MHLLNLTLQKKALLAYLTLMLLTLIFLMRIGYTTSDDVQIALSSFSESYKYAISAGRLTWVIAMPSTLISEIQGSIWFAKILRMLWVFALFHAAYLVLKSQLKILPTIFVLIFPLVFFVNGWEHHAFSSYPGLVVFGLANFLYSLYFLNEYLRTKQRILQLISTLFFSISFVTELFPTLFIFLLMYPYGRLWDRARGVSYHFLVLIIFAYFYLTFKADVQTYPLNFGWRAINTWFIYSFHQVFHYYGFSIGDFVLIGLNRCIRLLISAVLMLYLFNITRVEIQKNKPQISGCLIIWWALLASWINVPVALVMNYQNWVSEGSKSYLYSSLSNFSCSIGIGILVLLIFTKIKFKKIFFFAISVAMCFVLISHGIESIRAYKEQRYSHERWIFIDELARNNHFEKGTCYVGAWLFDPIAIVNIRTADYWDSYLLKNWGQKARILRSKSDFECGSYENLVDPR